MKTKFRPGDRVIVPFAWETDLESFIAAFYKIGPKFSNELVDMWLDTHQDSILERNDGTYCIVVTRNPTYGMRVRHFLEKELKPWNKNERKNERN